MIGRKKYNVDCNEKHHPAARTRANLRKLVTVDCMWVTSRDSLALREIKRKAFKMRGIDWVAEAERRGLDLSTPVELPPACDCGCHGDETIFH